MISPIYNIVAMFCLLVCQNLYGTIGTRELVERWKFSGVRTCSSLRVSRYTDQGCIGGVHNRSLLLRLP